jgi:hypothetical protein
VTLAGARLRSAGTALAIALTIAFWDTGFHVVSATEGDWRGASDPPGALRVLVSAALGAAAALLLAQRPAPVTRPLLWLGLAALPLVPVLTGAFPALLALQGPMLALLCAAVLCLALARALPAPIGPPPGPLLFAAAFAFYALLGAWLPGAAGPQGDEPHYLALSHSLLTDGDLDLSDEFAAREYRAFYAGTLGAHASPASPPGKLHSVHAPGLAVLLLPAYALGGYPAARIFMSALAALTGVLAHRLVRESTGSPGAALGAWLCLVFTPPLPLYAVSIYPEVPAALATAVFLRAGARDGGMRDLVLSSVAAAVLPWLHPKLLVLAATGLVLILARRRSWRSRLACTAALLVSLGALLLFFHQFYGRASLSAAYGPGFAADVSPARVPWGAAALIFDRQFGLLAVSPLWALALPGLGLLFRQRTGDALRASLLGASSFLVGASFSMWWGGSCPPARFVVPALPALALALAPALSRYRDAAAALAGVGIGIVALSAEAPRALHNRADGESALLRFVAPALDLDASLPSFVLGGASAPILAASIAGVLALGWLRGGRGLALGTLAYAAVSTGLRERPLIEPHFSVMQLLWAWDGENLRGVPRHLDVRALSLPLELPRAPWTLDATEIRNSRRVDLPPGAYRLEVDGRILEAAPTAHVTRLDLLAGELLLARAYLREGAPPPNLPVLLPAGARRLVLTASGVQGKGRVDEVRLRPEAIVPRRLREDFAWPRAPEDDRYRVGSGGVRVTVLDRSQPEGDGFRLEGEEGRFLVEAPIATDVLVRLLYNASNKQGSIVWGGRSYSLPGGASASFKLPTADGVTLGTTTVVPVVVSSRRSWVGFSGN